MESGANFSMCCAAFRYFRDVRKVFGNAAESRCGLGESVSNAESQLKKCVVLCGIWKTWVVLCVIWKTWVVLRVK